ncbi:MAG: 30S ribosomal protein S8 [Acidimicrobiales bacterium]
MSMTDPLADMLTRIRNANMAMHEEVKMPASKLKESLAKILLQEGYLSGYRLVGEAGEHPQLCISLKYSPTRERTISGISRVSKPGRRVYVRTSNVPRVLGGLGVAVLSTSKGLMTDTRARRDRVGGEVLCHVW